MKVNREIANNRYIEWQKHGEKTNVITLFTPTYNRATFLSRVYKCLLSQDYKRFVWILVNDGSSDNTDEVANELLGRNDIPMLYVSKSNGGKHRAFETAFNKVESEYFMCMDDDDIYSSEAIRTYLEEWKNIKNEGFFDVIGAIRTITQEADGRIVSQKMFDNSFMGQRIDQTTLESNYIKHEHFENWTCYRTEALRTIELFPKDYWMYKQHKFFSESIWQGRFARKYKCRYYFKVLREYRHDTENSIIRSSKSRQHYLDMFINTKMILDEQLDYIQKNPRVFIQDIAIVSILRHKLEIPLSDLLHNTNSVCLKVLYILSAPFACLVRNPQIKR